MNSQKYEIAVWRSSRFIIATYIVASALFNPPGSHAGISGKIVDVPARPAFIKLPESSEIPAKLGQRVENNSLLKTLIPGRMQVRLNSGRSFRLGGNTVLRVIGDSLELEKGQVIGWVQPGVRLSQPYRIKTRVGTSSIVGTTVYIDSAADYVRFFSWEGIVKVHLNDGTTVTLRSGDQLICHPRDEHSLHCSPPHRLSRAQLDSLRASVSLLHGYSEPMHTMPIIERDLGY